MLVHLDTRDLIGVFKAKGPNINELQTALRQRKAKLVYSVESIQEIVTPTDQNETRRRLEALIELPYCYIHQHKEVIRREFSVAIAAFKYPDQHQVRSVAPFVSNWQVVNNPGEWKIEDQIQDRLVELNMRLLATNPDAFRNTQEAFELYRPNFVHDRDNGLSLRTQEGFRDAIGQTLRIVGQHPSNPVLAWELVNGLADWMMDRPAVCPAWRLLGEVYCEFVRNKTDKGQLGDEPDYRHVSVAPYVDAITFDRRMYNYMNLASRYLSKTCEPVDYSTRVFRNLDDWLTSS